MNALFFLVGIVVAYLAGSINFAILISRWVRGIDIRSVGTKNPGTANVGREVGKGWAALVFLGDLAKGLIPLFLSKSFLFPEDHYLDCMALVLIGMAAITGHCWPLYHRFKGGGGLATSIGVYMFFVPVEFFVTLLVSYLAVQIFFRTKKYAYGQLVPMFFIPLAPLMVILSSLFLDIPVGDNFRIGGYPWYMITGVALLSVYIFMINLRIVRQRFSEDDSD